MSNTKVLIIVAVVAVSAILFFGGSNSSKKTSVVTDGASVVVDKGKAMVGLTDVDDDTASDNSVDEKAPDIALESGDDGSDSGDNEDFELGSVNVNSGGVSVNSGGNNVNVNSGGVSVNSNNGEVEKKFTIDSFPYGYSQDKIVVKKGDKVTIKLTNSKGLHDFVIDEFKVATKQIKQGETDTVTFVADKVGKFEYYCSVGAHRSLGMVGTLVVEE